MSMEIRIGQYWALKENSDVWFVIFGMGLGYITFRWYDGSIGCWHSSDKYFWANSVILMKTKIDRFKTLYDKIK